MLDLRQIREDPQAARDALARRGVDASILDDALELDERRRALLPELEDLRARKNQASKRIGELQRTGEDASEAIRIVDLPDVRRILKSQDLGRLFATGWLEDAVELMDAEPPRVKGSR